LRPGDLAKRTRSFCREKLREKRGKHFQSLEKSAYKFPIVGKTATEFSNHWKNRTRGFPIIGKRAQADRAKQMIGLEREDGINRSF
jgi:hypothetical protein